MDTKQKPLDKKQIFLLLFTRELIRNSGSVFLLKKMLEGKNLPEEQREEAGVQEAETENPQAQLTKSILSQGIKKPEGELSVVNPVSIKTRRMELSPEGRFEYPVLRIPEPKLPEEFQYLKPVPTRKEIDLEKLNPLIGDPLVRIIECEGPNKPIIVSGVMGRKPTEIVLSNNEIEDVINRFSVASKIPAETGLFKVAVGNLIFSAIISSVVPSKFIITKLPPQNQTTISNPNLRQGNRTPMPPMPQQTQMIR